MHHLEYFKKQRQYQEQISINQKIVFQKMTDDKTKIVIGSMKVNTIIKIFVPFLLTAPLISYYMAIKKGQEHKYPHPTITDTACHYPQDIQFRMIMGGSGAFLSFLYFILFKWIRYIKQKINYPRSIYSSIYYIAQLSVWGYMIAMGTIDGAWYPDLHTNSAVFFFLMLFIIVMTKTIVVYDMYEWDTSFMSKKSLIIKLILGIYVASVWAFTAISLLFNPQKSNDDQNVYIVILEWNSVYICLLWVFSFTFDWKQLQFTLSEYKKENFIFNKQINLND